MGIRETGAMFSGDQRVVRFLICDDHRILTEALSMMALQERWLEMVAEPVQRGDAAIQAVKEHAPEVVLMDVDLEGSMDGIEATRQIKAVAPKTKVVILTSYDESDFLVAAVEAGASGFVGKENAVETVFETLRSAADGDILVDPARLSSLVRKLAAHREMSREVNRLMASLTARESEVLRCLGDGSRNSDIARALHISEHTVQTHVRNILAKLGVHSKLEAVTFAAKAGVLGGY